jgi:hypothetical protein
VYRAVVLITLTLLLLAITGITLARESTFGPERDSLTEPTVQDTTTTGEPTATTVMEPTDIADEETTARSVPAAGSVTEDSTVPEAEEPEVAKEQATGGKIENMGRPGGVSKPKGAGGDPVGNGKAEDDEGEARGEGDQDKVTLCQNGKTLTVGASAQAAHVRHGDIVGSCPAEDAAPEPSEETPGAGVAQDGDGGGGNGQQKVALCHKGKTLTVGEPAKEAHLCHGDSEGPCAGQ